MQRLFKNMAIIFFLLSLSPPLSPVLFPSILAEFSLYFGVYLIYCDGFLGVQQHDLVIHTYYIHQCVYVQYLYILTHIQTLTPVLRRSPCALH